MFGTGFGVYLPLALYIAILVGTLGSIVWRPMLGIYLLAVVMPLQDSRYKLYDYPLGDHVLELLLLGVTIGLLLRGQSILPRVRFRILVLMIVALCYVTLWIGPMLASNVPLPLELGESPFGHWILYVRMFLLYLLVCSAIVTKRQFRILLLCMLLAFLWVNKGFRSTMQGRDTSHFSYNLRHGTSLGTIGPNGMAAFQVQCVLFLVGIFGAEKSKTVKLAVAAAAAIGLYAVVFSYSRGAYVALVVGLLYLGVFRLRILLPLLLLAVLSWQVILPKSVQERITMSYSEEEGLDVSSEGRVEIWRHALEVTLKDPLLGVGFDSYRFHRADQMLKDTHNMYLRALVETGGVGLVLLVAFWIGAFQAGHRLFRSASDPFLKALGLGFAAYMVALLCGNFFGDRWTYIEISGFTCILLALVVRGQMLTDEAKAAEASGEAAVSATGPVALPVLAR